ncbi:hypothetical protein V8C86DRAFT_649186 [Haematococcus lacustris]
MLRDDEKVDTVLLAAKLSAIGYTAMVRCALGGSGIGPGSSGGPGSTPGSCFRNLKHEFLYVKCDNESDAHAGAELVVDVTFREQFSIPQPTPAFQALLELTPEAWVGSASRLVMVVQLLCQEMASSFIAQGLTLPPWRRTQSMLSKWLPTKSRDILFDAGGSATPMGISPSGTVWGVPGISPILGNSPETQHQLRLDCPPWAHPPHAPPPAPHHHLPPPPTALHPHPHPAGSAAAAGGVQASSSNFVHGHHFPDWGQQVGGGSPGHLLLLPPLPNTDGVSGATAAEQLPGQARAGVGTGAARQGQGVAGALHGHSEEEVRGQGAAQFQLPPFPYSQPFPPLTHGWTQQQQQQQQQCGGSPHYQRREQEQQQQQQQQQQQTGPPGWVPAALTSPPLHPSLPHAQAPGQQWPSRQQHMTWRCLGKLPSSWRPLQPTASATPHQHAAGCSPWPAWPPGRRRAWRWQWHPVLQLMRATLASSDPAQLAAMFSPPADGRHP